MFSLEFRGKVNHEATRVMGLSSSEDRMIVAGVVLTQCQRVTDGQTDGQTDGFTIANTALCIASYADALYKLHLTAPEYHLTCHMGSRHTVLPVSQHKLTPASRSQQSYKRFCGLISAGRLKIETYCILVKCPCWTKTDTKYILSLSSHSII